MALFESKTCENAADPAPVRSGTRNGFRKADRAPIQKLEGDAPSAQGEGFESKNPWRSSSPKHVKTRDRPRARHGAGGVMSLSAS